MPSAPASRWCTSTRFRHLRPLIDETEDEVQARTADSELASFEAVDHDALSAQTLTWKEDGVATVFGQRWLEPGTDPLELNASTW